MESAETKEKKAYGDRHIFNSIQFAIAEIFRADKGTVIYSFYKEITEGIFNACFAIYLIKYIYECIEKGIDYRKLAWMVTAFCLIHIVIHLTSAGHAYYVRISEMKIYRYIFGKVICKAKTLGIRQYETPEFYDRFSRALDECLEYGWWGMRFFTWGIGRLAGAMTAMGIVVSVDPLLLLFAIPPVCGSLYFGVLQSREEFMLRREATPGKRQMEYAKRVFYEKKYAGELRLYPMAPVLFRQHQEGYEQRYEVNRLHRSRIVRYRALETLVFVGLVTLGSYLYITYCLKISGVPAAAPYMAMISAIGYVSEVVGDGITFFSEAGKRCLYMDNLRDFLEYEPEELREGRAALGDAGEERKEGREGWRQPGKDMGELSLERVTYTYPGSDRPVLENLSVQIHSGEHVALVGENGAGKTTLMKLLMGLYPLTQGQILAGGHPITEYRQQEYRDCFGTVFQDFQIFALSLAENVLMRSPEGEQEERLVEEALCRAGFGDVLERLPKGIYTMLTKEFDEEGFVCSGGQAQKIAIARVFAKNPAIVILDEPSSALDPIAEYNMYRNMMEASQGKTVFFISHRMSSARMADRILFLEQGRIVEEGSHQELMAKNGRYAAMFRLQAQNYQDTMGGVLYETE